MRTNGRGDVLLDARRARRCCACLGGPLTRSRQPPSTLRAGRRLQSMRVANTNLGHRRRTAMNRWWSLRPRLLLRSPRLLMLLAAETKGSLHRAAPWLRRWPRPPRLSCLRCFFLVQRCLERYAVAQHREGLIRNCPDGARCLVCLPRRCCCGVAPLRGCNELLQPMAVSVFDVETLHAHPCDVSLGPGDPDIDGLGLLRLAGRRVRHRPRGSDGVQNEAACSPKWAALRAADACRGWGAAREDCAAVAALAA